MRARLGREGIAALLAVAAAVAVAVVLVVSSGAGDEPSGPGVVAESGGPHGATGTPRPKDRGGSTADEPSQQDDTQGASPDASHGSGGSTTPGSSPRENGDRSQPDSQGRQPPAQTPAVPGANTAPPAAPGANEAPADAPSASDNPEPGVVRFTIRNGKPVEGFRRLTYTRGDRVRLRVNSDDAVRVIVYGGYDESVNIPAGGSGELDFVANVYGSYEVQLFRRNVVLAVLDVRGDLELHDQSG